MSIPTSAIAATADGLTASPGSDPPENTSTAPPESSRMNPAAICDRPALWTQAEENRWLYAGIVPRPLADERELAMNSRCFVGSGHELPDHHRLRRPGPHGPVLGRGASLRPRASTRRLRHVDRVLDLGGRPRGRDRPRTRLDRRPHGRGAPHLVPGGGPRQRRARTDCISISSLVVAEPCQARNAGHASMPRRPD